MKQRNSIAAKIAFLALGALLVAPLFHLLLLSLADSWPAGAPWPSSLGLDRWTRTLHSADPMVQSVQTSILISLSVASISTGMGFFASRYVAYHRWRRGLLSAVFIPFSLSPVVVGVCTMYVYHRMGLAGTVGGVVTAQIMFSSAFAMVFFISFWNARVRALEELVFTLGGRRWTALREVIFPMAAGPLKSCLYQAFLISWFQYGLTLLVGAGSVKTLPLMVYAFVVEADPYQAALASMLLVVPPLLLLSVRKVDLIP